MNQPSPEDFLEACGARSPVVLEIERQGQSEKIRHTLSLPFALIGRDERADLPLDDKSISSRHAYLQMAAGQLWYVDLGSRTGTHGQPGQPTGLLRGGQELRIGPFIVRRDDGAPSGNDAATLSNPLARDSSLLPRIGMDFLEGTANQSQWMVDRRLTLVGRADHCKVRLHSPTVSRTHCALLQTPAGLWLVDLLSREGTCVNGMAVRWARLEDADTLRIGQFVIRVRFLDRPQQATLPAPLATETAKTTNTLLPSAQSLVPSAAVAAARPADLEGLLSALQVAATPSDVRPASGGAAEAMLLPMIRQFALMQQQMFDQFQQSLLMMIQMFSGLHRDQLQLIRQELNQLSEVTRELQSLQAEQARQAPVPTKMETNSSAKTEFVPPAQPAAATPGGTPSQPSPPYPSVPTEKTPVAAAADSSRPKAEVHAWLAQRLATLQQERQSRWQRILHVLTGQ